MTIRFLWKNRREVAFVIVTLAFLYFWTDGFGGWSSYPLENSDHIYNPCGFPCLGRDCVMCKSSSPVVQVKDVDIVSYLHLQKVLRPNTLKQINDSISGNSGHVCQRPSFDLNHDSVKYAFFKMPKLNCSKEELFFIDNSVVRINKTKLLKLSLKKCVYFGIERASDDFASYTESLTKTSPPFDLILKHDFVRIKCYVHKTENITEDGLEHKQTAEKSLKGRLMQWKLNQEQTTANENQQSDLDGRNSSKYTSVDSLESEIGFKKVNNGERRVLTNSELHRNSRVLQHAINPDQADLDDDGPDDQVNSQTDDMEDENAYHYMESFDLEYEEADFDQFLVQVYPKAEVFNRIKKISPRPDFQRQPSVLMFGLDSMSRLSWQRKMPLTYKYLQEELGSVVLEGYNIVGDATTAALIPMLTGKTEVELPEVRKNQVKSGYVDAYPMVWKDFVNKGYATLYAEDEPSIGVFNLRLNGFQHPPTDHYMRPFWQALWESPVRKDSPRYCTGNVPNHVYLLNYTKEFFVKYANVSKFAFTFGSELTHWDNNPGEYMDADFVEMFEFLRKGGHLQNTVVIVFADHGARYSRVRKTVQGKMEERLPMMSIAVPKGLREKYPAIVRNLKRNGDKLTTPFDIHETLVNILDLSRKSLVKSLQNIPRGISLFDNIPANRTCSMAHIDMHWCTCLKQLELDMMDKHVQKAVNAFVDFLNGQTKLVRHLCEELRFKSLHHAFLLIPNEKVLMFQKSMDDDNRLGNFSSQINVDHAHFQITIATSPNKGLFETTVQVNMTSGSYTVLESAVSRLDRYGSQPACIQETHPDLRKYCYCKPGDPPRPT